MEYSKEFSVKIFTLLKIIFKMNARYTRRYITFKLIDDQHRLKIRSGIFNNV
jgi:hypothetical protein